MDYRQVSACDGTSIAYRVLGNGPHALTWLHAWGASGTGSFWDAMIQALNMAGLRIVAVDVRGHGRSEPGPSDFRIDHLVSDVLSVLDAEGVRLTTVVGHSVGGRIALRLAWRHPERVGAQVLFAPVPPIALPLPDALLDQWLEARQTLATWTQLLTQFTKDPLPAERAAAYFHDLSRAGERSLRNLFDICRQEPFPDALGHLACPTLIVGGAHDTGFPPDLLNGTLQALLPNARLVTLDCGHEIPLEQPAVAAALVEAFVTGR